MGIIYDDSSENYNQIIETINFVFTGIFILEAFLKIIAMGFRSYIHSKWNKFDFFVGLTSFIDIFLLAFGDKTS